MIYDSRTPCNNAGVKPFPHVHGQAQQKGHRVAAVPLVCIIDDDDSLRTALIGLLRSFGYSSRGFASAEAFLQSDALRGAACIVTDIQMPGMSGIDLKHHLVAQQCQVPVIMITARTEPGLEESALASGAVCFLRKPFEASALTTCLEQALKG
jgi:FixJ family two-component response regulator